jgi:hypothetical protein
MNPEHKIGGALYERLFACFETESFDVALQAAVNVLVDIVNVADSPQELANEIARKLPRWAEQRAAGQSAKPN